MTDNRSWFQSLLLPPPVKDLFFRLLFLSLFQVLSAATAVARHTSALCNACRLASSKTSNPVARRHFVQSAKEVANSTASLVTAIKVSKILIHSKRIQGCKQFFFLFPLLLLRNLFFFSHATSELNYKFESTKSGVHHSYHNITSYHLLHVHEYMIIVKQSLVYPLTG